MNARTAVLYSVLRLLAFLVPFGILMLFPVFQQAYILAAVFAAVIGLALSMLFLRGPRERLVSGLAHRRAAVAASRTDEEFEDATTEPGAESPGDQATNAQNRNAP